jgi:ATP/maltotriose-dependent transcriptional regulator MalT
MRLAAHLWRFWLLRGETGEGASWLERAIVLFRQQSGAAHDAGQDTDPDTDSAQLLASALCGAGILAIYQNRYQQAMASLQECLAIARKLDDKPRIALALHGFARMALRTGQFKEAESLYNESLALFGGQNNEWGMAQALLYWGLTLWAAGKFAQAHTPLERALAISRQIGDQQGANQALEAFAWNQLALGQLKEAQQLLESCVTLARAREDRPLLTRGLHGLGGALRRQGKGTEAYTALVEAFLVAFELEDKWHIAGCLVEIAHIALMRGEMERAARIVGASESLFPNINAHAPALSAAAYQELVTKLPTRLGEHKYRALFGEGMALAMLNELATWEQLIHEAPIAEALRTASATPLTEREQEVLRLLAQGLTNMQIAERLIVSPFTINAHLRNIYNKLDVPSRPAAIRYALEHQLA